MASYWTNSDGLRIRFGTLTDAAQGEYLGGETTSIDASVDTYFDFDKDNLLSAATLVSASDQGVAVIPDGAILLDAFLLTLVAFTGTGVIDVGLETAAAGTDLAGADTLFDGVDIDTELNTVSKALQSSTHAGTHSGDSLGTVILAGRYVPIVTLVSGTFTAGRGRLVIRWRKQTLG